MKSRLVFVDLLRGWATIVMIEVHVFNSFLITGFKQTSWFSVLDYVNGLVAPSFLFVAGFVFVISSDRKLEEFRTFGKAFWRQLSRICLIWFIGYGLHLPFFSLTRTMSESTAAHWSAFYQSDILHCIAIGMLIVFLGRIFIKSDRLYRWYIIGVGSFAVLFAPFIWDGDFSGRIHPFIAGYINGQNYSLFPLFPWLGFLVSGAVAAFAFKKARELGRKSRKFATFAIIGAAFLMAGSLFIELPVQFPGVSTAVRANPLFFMSRLGIVLLLLAACWFYGQKRKTENSFVLDVSKESLLVYTAHLLFIYGEYWNGKSLSYWYGGTFSIGQCILSTLGLMLAMVVAAKAWSWVKQTSLPWARYISYATGIIVLVLFIFRKS